MTGSVRPNTPAGYTLLMLLGAVIAAVACGGISEDEILPKTKAAMEEVSSYRLEAEVVSNGDGGGLGPQTQVTFQWNRPDTWRREVLIFDSGGSSLHESIRIGDRFFERVDASAGERWMEHEVSPVGSTGGQPSNISPPESLVNADLRPLEVTEEVIDGVGVFVVRHEQRRGGVDEDTPVVRLPLSPTETLITTTFLIRKSDFRLHGIDRETDRVTYFRPDPDQRETVQQSVTSLQAATNRFFDYGQSFDIRPPSSTK